MTDDLAAEGDRLHAARRNAQGIDAISTASREWIVWMSDNWPAIATALRERDEALTAMRDMGRAVNALRVQAETAEAVNVEAIQHALYRQWWGDDGHFDEYAGSLRVVCSDTVEDGQTLAEFAAAVIAAHAAAVEATP